MDIPAKMVKELRDKTGAGMMECKRALQDSQGDLDKATTLLRERGLAAAAKKADRAAREGLVGHYIHAGGKLGVLVEVNCETDFVARTDDFQSLVHEIAMQIAATNPAYVRQADIPSDLIARESEIYRNQALSTGKPEKVIEKIIDGKLKKYYAEVCLYEQAYIKDSDMTVEDLVKSRIAYLKENIVVGKFARFKIGD